MYACLCAIVQLFVLINGTECYECTWDMAPYMVQAQALLRYAQVCEDLIDDEMLRAHIPQRTPSSCMCLVHPVTSSANHLSTVPKTQRSASCGDPCHRPETIHDFVLGPVHRSPFDVFSPGPIRLSTVPKAQLLAFCGDPCRTHEAIHDVVRDGWAFCIDPTSKSALPEPKTDVQRQKKSQPWTGFEPVTLR